MFVPFSRDTTECPDPPDPNPPIPNPPIPNVGTSNVMRTASKIPFFGFKIIGFLRWTTTWESDSIFDDNDHSRWDNNYSSLLPTRSRGLRSTLFGLDRFSRPGKLLFQTDLDSDSGFDFAKRLRLHGRYSLLCPASVRSTWELRSTLRRWAARATTHELRASTESKGKENFGH